MDRSTSLWNGQRVFVTGCTGFLGTAVVEELLASGAEVIGLVRNRASAALLARHQLAGRVHIVHGKSDNLFRMHSAMAVYEVQAVFHLTSPDPSGFDRDTVTALDAVRRYDPRIPIVMARPTGMAPLTTSPVPLGIARFGELFGGDRKTSRFVPATVLAQLNGERLPLAERGPRDYVHVRDAARACLLLAEAVAGHPTPHVQEATFRSGWMLTDREMSSALREACSGRAAQLDYLPPANNPVNWSPGLNFAEAIADTMDWYRGFSHSKPISGRSSHRRAAA
jgi:nucleoside-diphosphate-sugar epimerase